MSFMGFSIMTIEPHDWNIVLVGYWNVAILTPQGIAQRLFELPVGESTFQIEVPIDGMGPNKVSYDNLAVLVTSKNLQIKLNEPNFDNLVKGFQVAKKALEKLPETPVRAAGFNLRYRVNKPDSEIAMVTQATIDSINDLGLQIQSWGLTRTIRFKSGLINLSSHIETDGSHQIIFNFHREADTPDKHNTLVEWLSINIGEIKKIVFDILNTIEPQENQNGN